MENLHPALVPVSPNECALAVTIPLTRKQFLADMSRPDEKDFVHHFRAQKGLEKAAAEFCWEVYEDEEATFVEAVCGEAKRLGVAVLYEARLADLNYLLNRFPVVTLVAHWRFVPIEPEDIRNAPRLVELMQSPQSHGQHSIKRALEILDSPLLRTETFAGLSSTELPERVAEKLSTVANRAERIYWDDSETQSFKPDQMHDGFSDRLIRLEFERAFPGCIAPARVIEFHDRIHTVPELIEAIPKDFSGLLDLTVCNSVIPADPIRLSRPNCLVAGNRRPAELRARMYLYGLEISLLAKQPLPFVEVIKQVHVGRASYDTKGGKLWNLFGKFFNSIRVHR